MRRKMNDLMAKRAGMLADAEAAYKSGDHDAYTAKMTAIGNINSEINEVKALIDEQDRQFLAKAPDAKEEAEKAAERGNALGAVDGGAAAEGQKGVRPQGLQARDALRHQRERGIGRDVGENLDLRAGKGRGIAGGRAVFGKIGVRDEQHALGVQPGKGRGGVRAEAQPRAADKALHDIASFRR